MLIFGFDEVSMMCSYTPTFLICKGDSQVEHSTPKPLMKKQPFRHYMSEFI